MSDKIIEFNWKLQAVKNIAPNCSFSTDNEGKINWGSGNPLDEPTKAEIDKEIARLKAEYENQTYARSRAESYDPIPEQLDQIFHSMDEWKARIKSVKDKYPKP